MLRGPNPRPPAFMVGDHLALDFLNSTSTPSGLRTEWLCNGVELMDWLEQAGTIDATVATQFRAGGEPLDQVAEQARSLREWFRAFVIRHAGSELGAEAVAELAPLNHLLAQDDSYWQVEAGEVEGERRPRLRRLQRWSTPAQLLQPIARAMSDLVCHEDFRWIRVCEGSACTLVFLDRTKAHARRWCSMAVCGNRAKAAAHRARAAGRRS